MLQRSIICLFLAILCLSCASDDAETAASACDLIDCGPESLAIQFVSSETGEDLLFNETFAIDSLQIINTSVNEAVTFDVATLATTERTIITFPFFVESTSENYLIVISDTFEIPFSFSVEAIDGPCCLGNIYSDVTADIENVSVELSDFGIYRLLF
ncbi:hypothetical protein [uncultured Dokdonia sp.]|uniref:hypothetical protein n=1 Tax=uncultured Dokdonia sp. TaxID=575653 RepID=UPI00262359B1|nr:hypothetical protein [uncultured Dokdonia sp.]